MKRKHYVSTLLGPAALALAVCASAQEAPDTSGWECEYCPEIETVSGWLMIGIGTVSGQAYKFADYTGLEDGGFGVGDANALYITEDQFLRVYWVCGQP